MEIMGLKETLNFYKGRRVFITGHTGFKGSWLTKWLLNLGANVIGISKEIPTKPAMFEILELEKKIHHIVFDITNLDQLIKVVSKEKPDFIFHLAAQAIVSKSYLDPVDTISSNVTGTMNILEALRFYKKNVSQLLLQAIKLMTM